ncbi:MAG: 50S ribosomal protein L23, partial [Actinomycetota bacterium]
MGRVRGEQPAQDRRRCQVKDPRDVIIRPVVSEKSYAGSSIGVYTFEVHPSASKPEIRD